MAELTLTVWWSRDQRDERTANEVRCSQSMCRPGAYGLRMFTDQEYVQKIEATFDDMAAFGQRLREPHYSAPGSQLAEDDTDRTPLSISQLA